jgi:hypothetical protein
MFNLLLMLMIGRHPSGVGADRSQDAPRVGDTRNERKMSRQTCIDAAPELFEGDVEFVSLGEGGIGLDRGFGGA